MKLRQRWQNKVAVVSTWFERDRAHVAVVEDDGQRTVVEWWDDAVAQAFDDGYFRKGDRFEASVIEYAELLGFN